MYSANRIQKSKQKREKERNEKQTNNTVPESNKYKKTVKLETFQRISPFHLEQALHLMRDGLPKSTKPNNISNKYSCLNISEKSRKEKLHPLQSYPEALENIRCAVAQHRWSDVGLLLPQIFSADYCTPIIWRSLLQVFCYHPESSPEKLEQFISFLCQQPATKEIIDSMFCTPGYSCSLSEGAKKVKTEDSSLEAHFLADLMNENDI